MLLDHCQRPITYLRFSITERCDFRCGYCRFGGKHVLSPAEESLTLDDCLRLMNVFVSLGIEKIRLTGGEPLLREDIVELVRGIRSTSEELEIAATTNGTLLEEKAGMLKEAGLLSINVSLDSLSRTGFLDMTGTDKLRDVLRGIDAAVRMGFERIGINVVIMRSRNLDEVDDFVNLAIDRKLNVRFIELMETTATEAFFEEEYVPGREVFSRIASKVPLVPMEAGHESSCWTCGDGSLPSDDSTLYGSAGNNAGPAKYFRIKGTESSIGFISPYREDFCDACNRIRLDSRGVLYPCLFSKGSCNLLELMGRGASDEELSDTIQSHVKGKLMARGDYPEHGGRRRPDMFRMGG